MCEFGTLEEKNQVLSKTMNDIFHLSLIRDNTCFSRKTVKGCLAEVDKKGSAKR